MPPRLPTELVLYLYTFFHVGTLLLARGVSHQWRSLLTQANVHPIRRELIDIYVLCVHKSWFLDSRPWTVGNLSLFDRQAYINALLNHYPYLPEPFQIWILEWPAKAAFACVWPGLPQLPSDEMGPFFRDRKGWNMLDSSNPAVWTLKYIDEETYEEGTMPELLPAIPLFHYPGAYAIWLVLDPREAFRGRVVYTVEEDTLSSALERNSDGLIFSDWIAYLRWEIARLKAARAWSDKQGKEWGLPTMETRTYRQEDRIEYVPWTMVDASASLLPELEAGNNHTV
ncbi:hypothetical protein ONZ45_g10277 [Pleurotus djamor]|nr:hypothetical protein ONZ45_g10277 [Pleurotus djamor]